MLSLSPSRTTPNRSPVGLRLIAGVVAVVCLLPMAAVVVAALTGGTDTLRHLADTVLSGYIRNTAALVVLVGLGTLVLGTGAAWLVTMTEFRGRKVLEIALVLPLAFPAYVLAYAYTHILDHPGIVQTLLRDATGWGARDYWFPEIRSLGGAAAMLILVLYPYVYLLARAAFLQQSATTFLAARALGQRPWQAFLRVSIPMARPAIASGVLLAVMETIADFGTVAYFGVQTFATGIYASWFSLADRAGAAQLALGILAVALLLALLERYSRGGANYQGSAKRHDVMARMQLTGWAGAAATTLCAVPVLLGCVVPVVALVVMGRQRAGRLDARDVRHLDGPADHGLHLGADRGLYDPFPRGGLGGLRGGAGGGERQYGCGFAGLGAKRVWHPAPGAFPDPEAQPFNGHAHRLRRCDERAARHLDIAPVQLRHAGGAGLPPRLR